MTSPGTSIPEARALSSEARTASRDSHIPQLDGIRGLAIILAMLGHSHSIQSHTIYRRLGLGNHLYSTEVMAMVVAFGLSLLIATISWRLYESPFLRLKGRFA